jgi:hypothetical protein
MPDRHVTHPIASELDAPVQSRPRLTIVVAWRAEQQLLVEWLAALAGAGDESYIDVVVVSSSQAGTSAVIPAVGERVTGMPAVRLLDVAPEQSPSDMRRAGMAAATGDVVVLTDDQEHDFHDRLASIITGMEQRSGSTA